MAKRIFIAFAKKDERIRDLIKGQSLHTDTDFEYVDMSVKQPYDSDWKGHVRVRIRGSDGVIALLSKNTVQASGELWEIQCAIEEDKPLLGLHIYKEDREISSIMEGIKHIPWTWAGLTDFINSLE